MPERTVVIREDKAQAIHLPECVAFPETVTDVVVLKRGKSRIIVPASALRDDFFDAPGVDIGERAQPAAVGPVRPPSE